MKSELYSYWNMSDENEGEGENLSSWAGKHGCKCINEMKRLEERIKTLEEENNKIIKMNKSLNMRWHAWLNDNSIINNIKKEIKFEKHINVLAGEIREDDNDILKDLFGWVVISCKMRHICNERIWGVDNEGLLNEIIKNDISFYKWFDYVNERLIDEIKEQDGKMDIVGNEIRRNMIENVKDDEKNVNGEQRGNKAGWFSWAKQFWKKSALELYDSFGAYANQNENTCKEGVGNN